MPLLVKKGGSGGGGGGAEGRTGETEGEGEEEGAKEVLVVKEKKNDVQGRPRLTTINSHLPPSSEALQSVRVAGAFQKKGPIKEKNGN